MTSHQHFRKFWVIGLVCCLSTPVFAQESPRDSGLSFDDEGLPRIIVRPSAQQRDRLALPSVRCGGADSVCTSIHEQLRRNLEMSTFFELLDPATFVANSERETLTETKWRDWFNVGARYLVKGSLSGTGPYDLELRFYNVLDKTTTAVSGQSHTGISGDDVRAAVNAFINGVIEAVTGTPGLFGSRIVYAVKTGHGTRGIGIMEMDGHGSRGIAGGDNINMFPHFAPGGGVLYTSFRSGKPDLYVGNERLTHDPFHYRGAAYSSNGQLAASLSKGSGSDIYLLSSDGTVGQRLTQGQGQNVSPTWSPDGSQLAFVSDRAGGPQVYVMSSSGGGVRRVTMAGSYNSTPDWGRNNRIAFAAMTGTGSDIFTVDLSGNMQRVTQDQGTNTDPCWSPNGRYLAFVSRRPEHGKRIWISSPDGRWQFPVSRRSAGYSTPQWGP